MSTRGESQFARLPRIAGTLYRYMMDAGPMRMQYRQIAADLVTRVHSGRLLDVGTGHGQLLCELHALTPDLELFGLDISPAMVALARARLGENVAEVRLGSIQTTDYPDDEFDAVTCSGSFYLWDHPLACLEEIDRILKPDGSGTLYETYRDADLEAAQLAMRGNLAGENLLRRQLSPSFLMRQLRMTYSLSEIEDILQASVFSGRFTIDHLTLAGLPIWARISLKAAA